MTSLRVIFSLAVLAVAGPAGAQVAMVQVDASPTGGPNATAADPLLGPNARAAQPTLGPNGAIAHRTRAARRDAPYPSCAAARTERAVPVRRGQPGYGRHLDPDGDGEACE
jgi:hypothetical protein